jgi:hypothetical protein
MWKKELCRPVGTTEVLSYQGMPSGVPQTALYEIAFRRCVVDQGNAPFAILKQAVSSLRWPAW